MSNSDGAEDPPSAGDSQASFTGNQPQSCDEAGCDNPVDYLSKYGAFCDFHAWTNGVQRWTPDQSLAAGKERDFDE